MQEKKALSSRGRGLKSLLQHHSSKGSILHHSAFFTVQLSHPYMATGKTIALTRWTFVGKVMSLLLNMLSRLDITFLPRSKCLLISWLPCPWDFLGKNTGVGCYFLPQRIFLTRGSHPCHLGLLHRRAGSLPLVPPGKPNKHFKNDISGIPWWSSPLLIAKGGSIPLLCLQGVPDLLHA